MPRCSKNKASLTAFLMAAEERLKVRGNRFVASCPPWAAKRLAAEGCASAASIWWEGSVLLPSGKTMRPDLSDDDMYVEFYNAGPVSIERFFKKVKPIRQESARAGEEVRRSPER